MLHSDVFFKRRDGKRCHVFICLETSSIPGQAQKVTLLLFALNSEVPTPFVVRVLNPSHVERGARLRKWLKKSKWSEGTNSIWLRVVRKTVGPGLQKRTAFVTIFSASHRSAVVLASSSRCATPLCGCGWEFREGWKGKSRRCGRIACHLLMTSAPTCFSWSEFRSTGETSCSVYTFRHSKTPKNSSYTIRKPIVMECFHESSKSLKERRQMKKMCMYIELKF